MTRLRARRGRRRGLLSLGMLSVVAMAAPTGAFWTDSATMPGTTIASGSLDLLIDGHLGGPGGSWTNPGLGVTGLVPGESLAVTVPVQRAPTSVGFTYDVRASASGGLSPHLRWWAVPDSTAQTPQVDANGLRSNDCSGGVTGTGAVLGATSTTLVSARPLTGASLAETVCIRLELPLSADNTAQSTTSAAVFVFAATQVG